MGELPFIGGALSSREILMTHAFHDMLIEHLPRLRAYAILMTRNRSAADDLIQETALKALRAEAQFTPGTNFGAWMYRILRNEFISSRRRAKRAPARLEDVSDEVLARKGTQESNFFCGEIIRAMESLQEGQREVLILICASGLSYEEAAEMLQCSVGTVKSRLWRARASMEKLLMGDDNKAEKPAVQVRVPQPDMNRLVSALRAAPASRSGDAQPGSCSTA
jgi:RNA polymerase sigma-70 factor (ECF subfamily)